MYICRKWFMLFTECADIETVGWSIRDNLQRQVAKQFSDKVTLKSTQLYKLFSFFPQLNGWKEAIEKRKKKHEDKSKLQQLETVGSNGTTLTLNPRTQFLCDWSDKVAVMHWMERRRRGQGVVVLPHSVSSLSLLMVPQTPDLVLLCLLYALGLVCRPQHPHIHIYTYMTASITQEKHGYQREDSLIGCCSGIHTHTLFWCKLCHQSYSQSALPQKIGKESKVRWGVTNKGGMVYYCVCILFWYIFVGWQSYLWSLPLQKQKRLAWMEAAVFFLPCGSLTCNNTQCLWDVDRKEWKSKVNNVCFPEGWNIDRL